MELFLKLGKFFLNAVGISLMVGGVLLTIFSWLLTITLPYGPSQIPGVIGICIGLMAGIVGLIISATSGIKWAEELFNFIN